MVFILINFIVKTCERAHVPDTCGGCQQLWRGSGRHWWVRVGICGQGLVLMVRDGHVWFSLTWDGSAATWSKNWGVEHLVTFALRGK